VSTVLDNTFSPLVAYFAGKEKVSREELEELRKLVEKHTNEPDGSP
jgi:predicted transcriptional regulator